MASNSVADSSLTLRSCDRVCRSDRRLDGLPGRHRSVAGFIDRRGLILLPLASPPVLALVLGASCRRDLRDLDVAGF